VSPGARRHVLDEAHEELGQHRQAHAGTLLGEPAGGPPARPAAKHRPVVGPGGARVGACGGERGDEGELGARLPGIARKERLGRRRGQASERGVEARDGAGIAHAHAPRGEPAPGEGAPAATGQPGRPRGGSRDVPRVCATPIAEILTCCLYSISLALKRLLRGPRRDVPRPGRGRGGAGEGPGGRGPDPP